MFLAGELPSYPCPNLTLTLTFHFVRFGEGWVGSFPETYIDPQRKTVKYTVKSVYEPSGPSVPEFIPVTVATWSISTPPPPPLDGILVHRNVTPSYKFAGTQLHTRVQRGTIRVKCLAQQHNAVPRPGLEPGPLDPEYSTVTI